MTLEQTPHFTSTHTIRAPPQLTPRSFDSSLQTAVLPFRTESTDGRQSSGGAVTCWPELAVAITDQLELELKPRGVHRNKWWKLRVKLGQLTPARSGRGACHGFTKKGSRAN